MTSYRIKIDSADMCQEVQELLFKLGNSWCTSGLNFSFPQKEIWLHTHATQIFWCHDADIHDFIDKTELTLNDLRDMVVLHRNNPEDATHENTMYRYREFADGWYFFDKGSTNKWVKSSCPPHSKYYELLELITKETPEDIHKKEYLLPTNQGYELCLCEEGMTIHESWIKIPKGADTLAGSINSDEYRYFFDHKNKKLIGCGPSLSRYPVWAPMEDSANDWLDELDDDSLSILWQRELPAVASPNDIAKTAEVHREHSLSNELNDLCVEFGCLPGQNRINWLRDRLRGTRKPETLYHYSASINTARGTVAYDGVITFPGRITGMEDYQQARAEIAKDGNVAPEQVNIHSLSIIN